MLVINRLVEDAAFAVRRIETLLFGKYEKRIPMQLFMDSEGTLESTKKVERKSLRMVIQDLKERLIDEEIALYQWIPMDLMWVAALTKDMEMHDNMRSLLMKGKFELRDDGINKVKFLDGKIRMINIRHREKSKIKSPQHTNMLT